MPFLGERLKTVRVDLDLSQQQMADKCGVTMRSQRNYEKGERLPDAAYMAALVGLNIDVQYILTGVRSSVALAPDERVLIDLYRGSSAELKKAVLNVLTGGGQSAVFSNVVHGSVGKQVKIDGNVKQKNVKISVGKKTK